MQNKTKFERINWLILENITLIFIILNSWTFSAYVCIDSEQTIVLYKAMFHVTIKRDEWVIRINIFSSLQAIPVYRTLLLNDHSTTKEDVIVICMHGNIYTFI